MTGTLSGNTLTLSFTIYGSNNDLNFNGTAILSGSTH